MCLCVAVIRGRDPSAVMVMLEDGAAVAGVMLATGCLGLTSYTGSPVFDAMGSIMIGGNKARVLISHLPDSVSSWTYTTVALQNHTRRDEK